MAVSILYPLIKNLIGGVPNQLFGKYKNGNKKPKNEKTYFQQKI